MLFKKNQINKYQVIIIILFFLGLITSSCSRKKAKPQRAQLASYEFPTRKVPFSCQKTFETLTLLLKRFDLKRVSFKKNFIKTHWIDNTFSFFSKEKNNILEKSAKFKLYLKGKTHSNNKESCKLTIFKNQKVKNDSSSPWNSTSSDLSLEEELFSSLMEGRKNKNEYLPIENEAENDDGENDSDLAAQEEDKAIEDIEEAEDTESIEDIESIEKGETSKKEKINTNENEDEGEDEGEDEESIESIESLES